MIIVVHELGHFIVAKMCKFRVEKIIIFPFGGVTILNEKINHSLNKELLIAISGPLFQIIFIKLLNNELFYNIHISILLFNLLPIYPLDGSKILNVFLNKMICYKTSYTLTIFISYLTIVIILFSCLYNNFNLVFILILLLLLSKVIKSHSNMNNSYNKFLLERYLYDFNYKKIKRIKSMDKMYLNKRHLIKCDKWCTEKEILRKLFDKNI